MFDKDSQTFNRSTIGPWGKKALTKLVGGEIRVNIKIHQTLAYSSFELAA